MAVIATIQKKLNRLSEIPKTLASIKTYQDELIESAARAFQVANGFAERTAQTLKLAQEIERLLTRFSAGLITSFEELPERFRQEILTLAEHSWYVTLQMPCTFPTKLARGVSAGKLPAVDEALCGYYEKHFLEECEALFNEFPDRKSIIRNAFAAHGNGWFELSVPVFLVQADGICQAMTGIGLYSKQKGDRQLKSFVDSINSTGTLSGYLHPLEIVLPIIAPSSQRTNSPAELNRHAILHGECTNYATRTNSCKSMSLVAYVYSIIDHCKNPPVATEQYDAPDRDLGR